MQDLAVGSPSEPSLMVTVILVCYNSSDWLPRCIGSIRAQTLFERTELIVVDNASSDDTERVARQLTQNWTNAQVIQTGANLGFSANNVGARVARGKYLYLFNPDAWLEPDCLEQFCCALESAHATAAGGIILEYEDDRLQAKGSHGFDIFGNPVSPSHGRDPSPLFCIAGFYFIERELFYKLGMLDEDFFMYGEEMDLSWRIWVSGSTVVYAPAAKCHHRGAAGINPAGQAKRIENRTSISKRFLANRNFLLVIAKNAQNILLLLLLPCLTLIIFEGIITLLFTRQSALAKQTCIDPVIALWRMRHKIAEQRRRIRSFRRRGDFWMLRFLRIGFGRSHEIREILKRGFPVFSR